MTREFVFLFAWWGAGLLLTGYRAAYPMPADLEPLLLDLGHTPARLRRLAKLQLAPPVRRA